MNEQVEIAIGGYEDDHPVNLGYIQNTSRIEHIDGYGDLQEALWRAVDLLKRQKNRVCYPMDKQIENQKQVDEFIKRWK